VFANAMAGQNFGTYRAYATTLLGDDSPELFINADIESISKTQVKLFNEGPEFTNALFK